MADKLCVWSLIDRNRNGSKLPVTLVPSMNNVQVIDEQNKADRDGDESTLLASTIFFI